MEIYFQDMIPFSAGHWPNRDSAVVKLAGSNYKCPYSNEPELIEMKEEFLTEIREVQKQILEQNQKNIMIAGGEPALQQEGLIKLARFCKSKGINMGIETNGSKYFTIKKLIDHALVDFIRLDIKAPLTKEELFEKVTKSATFFKPSSEIVSEIRKTIKLLKGLKLHRVRGIDKPEVELEVRTTIVPGLMFRKEDVLEIGRELEGLKCTWVLEQFYRHEDERLLDKRFESIKFPSPEFLKNMKKVMQDEYPETRIEVRTYT